MTDLQLAQLCAATYDVPTVTTFPFICQVVTVADQLAIVADDPDGGKVVAVRGSSNILNWMEDFDTKLVPHPWGLVHEGFANAESLLWSALAPVLIDAGSVAFTGHSLGGPCAALLAARWLMLKEVRCGNGLFRGLVTFGCPRVGNAKFASALRSWVFGEGDDLTRRYHHRYDPVPMVPFVGWGYLHPNWPVWWDGEKWTDISVTKAWGVEAGRIMKRVWKSRREVLRDALTDHNIDNYVRCLTPDNGSGT